MQKNPSFYKSIVRMQGHPGEKGAKGESGSTGPRGQRGQSGPKGERGGGPWPGKHNQPFIMGMLSLSLSLPNAT